MRRLAVTVVHPSSANTGSIASMVVRDRRVWTAGGTGAVPTCMYSHDGGRSFVRWASPAGHGLRGVAYDGERVWVVGQAGMVAHTDAGDGESWERVDVDAPYRCLYAIKRCAHGLLTVVGDGGTVIHTRNGKKWRRVKTLTDGSVFDLFVEPGATTWLVDSNGRMQRWTKTGYVNVPISDAMWPKQRTPLCGLARTRRGTLVAIGDGGAILRSATDGTSWQRAPIDSSVDLERILMTRLGVFVIGDRGSLLVSYDDGRSFQGFTSELREHLWSLVEIDGDLLVGGERGQIWRIDKRELAAAMRDAFADRDRVIADLASRVCEGEEGAELVLDDAIRERELW